MLLQYEYELFFQISPLPRVKFIRMGDGNEVMTVEKDEEEELKKPKNTEATSCSKITTDV